jgi:hypothetical protein
LVEALRLRADICWLRIEVFDTDPETPRPRTPAEGDESGFGFVLIEALATRWGVHQAPGGKTVWAELTTGTAEAPDASPLSQGGVVLVPACRDNL